MNEFLTLMDLKNSMAPGDGELASVAEVLVQEEEILKDMSWARGNLITGDVHFRRSVMPRAQTRMINQGIESSASKKEAHTDTCIEFASRSIVDMMELSLAPSHAEYLLSEARPHIAKLGEMLAYEFIYGTDTSGILGLASRYGRLTGEKARQVVDFEGSGANLTSVYFVKWDTNECTGIYPKNSQSGLSKISKANELIPDKDGNMFRAHVTDYSWMAGLKLRDHRYAARLCNIDMDELRDETDGPAAQQKLFDLLITAKNRVYKASQGRIVMYVSPDLYTILEIAAFKKSNMSMSYGDVEGSTRILRFSGIPIRSNDCQLKDETAVAA
ncbi:MAG: hypothetical protein LBR87_03050 [Synergistaceae bacterium]|nr:hypothetical protein [Synergistaceae bacterium]